MFTYDHEITKSILGTSLDAVFTIHQNGTIIDANSAAEKMFGWPVVDLVGQNISLIVSSPHKEAHDQYLLDFNPERGVAHILGNGRLLEAQRKDGSLFPVEVGISSFERSGDRYFTGFVRDMSERQSHVDELHWHATRDDETKLINYKGILDCAKRSGNNLAGMTCIVVQLQWLARCIAAQGRSAGQHIVRVLANRIQECIEKNPDNKAICAKTSEDYFTLFAIGDVLHLAACVRDYVNEPIAYEGGFLQVMSRIGVSTSSGEIEDRYREAVVASERVDRYHSGIQQFSQELSEHLERELLIESGLRSAVSSDSLTLMLQPKICLRTGRILGAEALVRWSDLSLGSVSPAEFIPIAEKSGQIVMITEWVLEQSLSAIGTYEDEGLSVAVNFSAIDFQQHDMVQKVSSALSKSAVNPSQLVIELTESAVADDPVVTARKMSELKSLGVAISLDDFGTGYSSLSYLRQFPIDSLKIDASFVRHTPGSEDANAIATAITAMAKALHLETIAEGVETLEQARFLTSLKVDLCQGYLFAKPLSLDQFHVFAKQRLAAYPGRC